MIEYRRIDGDEVEMRAADGDGMTLTGYAARFNSRSEDMGFRETIEPGAFAKTLKARNEVKALINHNSDYVIGSTRAGTLVLNEDDKGLADHISLPDTSFGRDLSVSVARRDISAQSFGFSVVRDEWSKDYSQRRLIEVRLHEVSIVAMPAYTATSANVRALARLAYRTQMDVDVLTEAVSALESGAELTEEQFTVLQESIDRSRAKTDEPAAPTTPLSLLQKQIDLMGKEII